MLGAFVASACVYGVYYGECEGILWWFDIRLFIGLRSNRSSKAWVFYATPLESTNRKIKSELIAIKC